MGQKACRPCWALRRGSTAATGPGRVGSQKVGQSLGRAGFVKSNEAGRASWPRRSEKGTAQEIDLKAWQTPLPPSQGSSLTEGSGSLSPGSWGSSFVSPSSCLTWGLSLELGAGQSGCPSGLCSQDRTSGCRLCLGGVRKGARKCENRSLDRPRQSQVAHGCLRRHCVCPNPAPEVSRRGAQAGRASFLLPEAPTPPRPRQSGRRADED